MWSEALPYLATAGGTLAVSTVVQLWVVPAVETRKRREARWEADALALGEFVAFDLADAASEYVSALRRQIYMNDVPDDVDPAKWAAVVREVKEDVQKAYDVHRRASKRAQFLVERLTRHEIDSSQEARRATMAIMAFSIAGGGLVFRPDGGPPPSEEVAAAADSMKQELERLENYAEAALRRPAGSVSRPLRSRAQRVSARARKMIRLNRGN